jgi:uroporphyrinogen-III synthase
MRLLITRPKDDASAIGELLRTRGHDPIIAPLMEVHYRDGPPLALGATQALLATSANGVHALSRRTDRRDLPLYAVGPQTAEAARTAGFASVFSAEGDAAMLVEFVAARIDPAKGQLLHAAGAETAGRLKQALHAKGFTVDTSVLYDAVPVTTLPEHAHAALENAAVDGVLLFSPRSAKIFVALIAAAELSDACAKLEAYCISAATAAELTPLSFARVAVAGAPNQDAMVALIPPASPIT